MKKISSKFILSFVCVFILLSCNNQNESNEHQKSINDSISAEVNDSIVFSKISDKAGVVGIFNVPEMLTICKLDSGSVKEMSFKVAKNYSLLEEEMNAIGAQLDGSPGMIAYNNDTTNFVFECVLPIKEFPKMQPKKCKIVVLEAAQMLIYNHYGPYQNLHFAYDSIKKYNADNKLKICGQMREFYLSDPTLVKDPSKWETRILVPVIKSN